MGLVVLGMHRTTPRFCVSVRFPGTNICEKRLSQSSFSVFQVSWNRISPIPSHRGAFLVFSFIMAVCSSSGVREPSRAIHHSSDRRPHTASSIFPMLSSDTRMGLYLSRKAVLNTFTMPFVVFVGIPPAGSCTEVIVHCTLLFRRLINW